MIYIMMMKMTFMTKRNSIDELSDKFRSYRNRLNGEIVLSPRRSKPKFIDGVEFIEVMTNGRSNYMRKDNLEFIPNSV